MFMREQVLNMKTWLWMFLIPVYGWNFGGGRWTGPYEVVSRNVVTYKIRSKEGQQMVPHHDKLKQCVIPANKGIPHYPAPEPMDINILTGGPITPGEGVSVRGGPVQRGPIAHGGENCDQIRAHHRPVRLRQTINPL